MKKMYKAGLFNGKIVVCFIEVKETETRYQRTINFGADRYPKHQKDLFDYVSHFPKYGRWGGSAKEVKYLWSKQEALAKLKKDLLCREINCQKELGEIQSGLKQLIEIQISGSVESSAMKE